jgi:transcriptional regulator with XRE-family HTH domain
MNIKEKLGQRIRKLREEEGLSQEKFAHKCGLDRTYIASIEKGRRNVSLVNIKKIADAFDISVSELFKDL